MKTKILFAAAESVPFFKTGGLADVIGSLPEFLAESASPETGLDVEVKVILPFYRRLANFEKECSVVLKSTLNFAGKDFILDEPYKQFDLIVDNPQSAKEIKLNKDDVILENNGVFSFSKSSLFNPDPHKIDRFFKIDDNIKYIIADYEAPLDYVENGFKTKTISFNTKTAYRENSKYNFMISIPGLNSSASSSDYLEIKEIRLDFSGRTLWQKLFKKNI